MKAFFIEIYNDAMVERMQQLKNEQGISFSQQCRIGLRMYLKSLESEDGKK